MSKNIDELAVNLIEAWLDHESMVSQDIGGTSMNAKSKSIKEVAQAYLDFHMTIATNELPDRLTS